MAPAAILAFLRQHTYTPAAANTLWYGEQMALLMVQLAVWDQVVWLSAHGTSTTVEVLKLSAVWQARRCLDVRGPPEGAGGQRHHL